MARPLKWSLNFDLINRWNGVVVLKPQKKYYKNYNKEKKLQLRGRGQWHMHFLIRQVSYDPFVYPDFLIIFNTYIFLLKKNNMSIKINFYHSKSRNIKIYYIHPFPFLVRIFFFHLIVFTMQTQVLAFTCVDSLRMNFMRVFSQFYIVFLYDF